MKNKVRLIDANALARNIREYMDSFPNATTRIATCRVILSMLGDEGQTPTITAHIDKGAWEPCGECEKKTCDNCQYSEYFSRFEPCRSCENASRWKPMQNFCGECGRPLTEEARAMLEKRLRG